LKEEAAMPKFSANLNFLFHELPFLERFGACREAGFSHVEYMFPYEHPKETLRGLLAEHGLRQVLFNLPAGNWGEGDRGIASHPGRIREFREGVEAALDYARTLNVERINCLVGKSIEGVAHEEQWGVLVENFRYAARGLAGHGRLLLVEPLNTLDIPGFFLNNTGDAWRLLAEVGEPNVRLQYDAYHMQRMEGNLTLTIQEHLSQIGHIQIADNPGRHQPGTGEINYAFLLGEIDRLGYGGFVGLEYAPVPDTRSSLAWVREMGYSLSSAP
jgi:hydroxypyruvate isomerase